MGLTVIGETWRLIDSGHLDGITNMAVDEAMARFADESDEDVRATLRTYGWRPYAISLGYHQSVEEIDLHRCRQDGIDVVKRPTGGRAILHAEELTYAVVIPRRSGFFDKSILKTYGILSRAIVAGLNELGVGVEFEQAPSTPKDFSKGKMSMLCFASSVQHEIGWQGRKLVGSAQRRIGETILQHGSILIGPQHLRLVEYLKSSGDRRKAAWRHLQSKTICLNELTENSITFSQVHTALCRGFEKQLGIRLCRGELDIEEKKIAESLAEARRSA